MILSVLFLSLLSSCTTTPLKIPFPNPPQELMESPPELNSLPENKNTKLSDVGTTITENYAMYYDLMMKYKAWQDWAKKQKELNP